MLSFFFELYETLCFRLRRGRWSLSWISCLCITKHPPGAGCGGRCVGLITISGHDIEQQTMCTRQQSRKHRKAGNTAAKHGAGWQRRGTALNACYGRILTATAILIKQHMPTTSRSWEFPNLSRRSEDRIHTYCCVNRLFCECLRQHRANFFSY